MPAPTAKAAIRNKLRQLVEVGVLAEDGSSVASIRLAPGEESPAVDFSRVTPYTHRLASSGYVSIRFV